MHPLEVAARARLPTRLGEFEILSFGCSLKNEEHVALVKGDVRGANVLTRIHSSCLTGDALFSARCDCGAQLEEAMRRVEAEGRGVIVYLNQEGRGIGLANKIRAYVLQDQGANTVEANEMLGLPPDARNYGCAAAVLRSLGVESVRLLTNNPEKVSALEASGMRASREAIIVGATDVNRGYLRTKKEVMGHLFE
ncbi:MAG: GTP cyclohydrolase II [Thermoplasmatota archaeon]